MRYPLRQAPGSATHHFGLLDEAAEESGASQTQERPHGVQEGKGDGRADEEENRSNNRDDKTGAGACG